MTVERYLMEALKSSPVYVEDVFSTYLYTGNGSTQTITNNIDLATKGGLVWLKSRSAADYNSLSDTTMPSLTNFLVSSLTNGFITAGSNVINSYNTNGFTLNIGSGLINQNGGSYVGWTFRKQPKFFDVVTYTGDGTNNRQIPHALGSTPGMIICKRTGSAGDWWVYHVGMGSYSAYLKLNTTAAAVDSGGTPWGQPPTSTYFVTDASGVNGFANANGQPYVAYLFANQAGGFGLSGSDSVVACGSFTANASGIFPAVNLGWEPQYLLIKKTDGIASWTVYDTMRGMSWTNQNELYPNNSNAEYSYSGSYLVPTATGFSNPTAGLFPSGTYIYLAIRRGPMKVPTSGTSVFSPIYSSAATGTTLTTNFVVDMQIPVAVDYNGAAHYLTDRLRGASSTTTESGYALDTSNTGAEFSAPTSRLWNNNGFQMPSGYATLNTIFWNFARAPGFMDVVCYPGPVAGDINHNLGVPPELIIVKNRTSSSNWSVWQSSFPVNDGTNIYLDSNAAKFQYGGLCFQVSPTSSTFQVRFEVATYGQNYVAYLFATCPGVSKVGSYTGTATAQNINCGFSAGARFILIKRTDSTGDWYTYDSARGISSGNDPYILLNSTAAQVTGTNYVDTFASGFTLTASAPAGLNANGGSYIFLAIA